MNHRSFLGAGGDGGVPVMRRIVIHLSDGDDPLCGLLHWTLAPWQS